MTDNNDNNDLDKDGIPDVNEIPGSTFFGLPLYDWGARSNIADIFVHISYMEADDRGIIPQKPALDKIVAAFANKNINVHFDVGDLFDQALGADPNDYDLSDTNHTVPYLSNVENFTSVSITYKNLYLPADKKKIFYYALFGNTYIPPGRTSSYSGVANVRGTRMLITLGSRFTSETSSNFVINRQAGVLMHELGHNLGLLHGGNESQNFKPNYLSIMNYMYGSRRGLPFTFGQASERYYFQLRYHITNEAALTNLSDGPYTETSKLDFSDGTSINLNEANLNEYNGIGRDLGAIDWNTNGSTNSNLFYNINPDPYNIINADSYTNISILSDYNDWDNLYFIFYHQASINQLRVAESSWSPICECE